MTIRRRFILSFLGIMTLFAFNAGVYVWSDGRRSAAVEDLRRAIQRQVLLSSVQLTINDTQKQIGVLSQVASEAGAVGVSPAEKAQLAEQLGTAEKNVIAFRKLSGQSAIVAEFAETFEALSASWRVFYDNFGVNQTKAISELAIRAEPLSRSVIQELMPRLQVEQNQLAETAGENFRTASHISDQITFSTLFFSAILALAVMWLVARDIARGLKATTQRGGGGGRQSGRRRSGIPDCTAQAG